MADVPTIRAPIGDLDQGTSADLGIAELADRQHGVVALRQLLALGLSRKAVKHRLRLGRLHVIHPGVYAVGHKRLTWQGRLMAAVLWAGDGALVSHRSAALLWEVLPSQRAGVDVTVCGRRQGRPRIDVHETRLIHPDDRTEIDGLPVTSLERTMLDLAEVERRHRLEKALEESVRLNKLDGRKLDELLGRSNGRRGLKPLRTALADVVEEQPALTRSEAERALNRICKQHGLPTPQHNATVEGFEVDAYWPSHKLIVEIDGYEFHRSLPAFKRDRSRDIALDLAGYRVLRFTDDQLFHEPEYVAAVLSRRLRG